MTRSCPTRRPRRLGVRHTLSLDPRIQCPFASLGNCCCFLESGCKDTTFFQTEKIFFRKNPTWRRKHAAVQGIAARKKICMNGKNDRKRPKKQRKNDHFSQKSGVGRATKIQYSCIILIFNDKYYYLTLLIKGITQHNKLIYNTFKETVTQDEIRINYNKSCKKKNNWSREGQFDEAPSKVRRWFVPMHELKIGIQGNNWGSWTLSRYINNTYFNKYDEHQKTNRADIHYDGCDVRPFMGSIWQGRSGNDPAWLCLL